MKKIFGKNIYENFDDSKFLLDKQGWGGKRAWFTSVVKSMKPELIIEVGTWKGQSAITMAKALKENGSGKIICVDTWLGSPEHWFSKKEDRKPHLRLKDGYPGLFYQFLANVKKEKLQEQVIPLPNTSINAAKMIGEHLALKADLIYIDGAHEEEQVAVDLRMYWKLLKKGGVMVGDDYAWTGVKKAADSFAKENNLTMLNKEGLYIFTKNV